MAEPLAIETRGLTHSFGSRLAVDRLGLKVLRGTIYGFLGPNGAGKTTTIRLLLGLLKATSGSIFIEGGAFTPHQRTPLQGIGAVVEGPSLYPHLTGEENLEVTRRLRGASASRIADVLALVDLTADARSLVRVYSTGMRQRLALALALLAQPRLLLLDEPANGLDPSGIRDLRLLLKELAREQGVTVFVSSHALAEVEQIADDVGIINRGRLLFQGPLRELPGYGRDTLEDIFLNVVAQSPKTSS
jgi:lantibiotic transport system ATP-binding protein